MLSGYEMFRCDRATNNMGGGVLLYVRSVLKPIEYSTGTKYPEHVWCKIRGSKNQELLIGVCYRSGDTKIYADGCHVLLRELLTEVSTQHTLILGDFNYKDIDWCSNSLMPAANVDCQMFLACLEDNFYMQHVTTPTRGNSVLDLILSREPELVSDVRCLDHLATSDHNALTCTVHMECEEVVNNKVTFDYNRADYDGMKEELRKTDWEQLLRGEVNECWEAIKQRIIDLEKQFVPVKRTKNYGKRKPIWMTHKAVKLTTNKRKVYAKYKDKDHPAVRKSAKKATKEVKRAKKNFEKKLAKNIKQDKKTFFAYMRSKSKTRAQQGH